MASASDVAQRPNREMEFDDGSSRKFWRIALNGSAHTVTFGRIGTSGQTQTKAFDSEEAAAKSYDKLVAEKLKKGYVETQTGTTAAPVAIAPTATPKATPVKKAAAGKSKEAASEAPAQAPSDSARELVVEHELRLTEADWAGVAFRQTEPVPRAEPRPFDREECLQRLAKLKTNHYGWNICWGDLKLPASLSGEEAHFWLAAMTTHRTSAVTPKDLAEQLKRQTFDGKLSADDIAKLMTQSCYGAAFDVGIPLRNLLSPADIFQVLQQSRDRFGETLRHIVPLWSAEEGEAFAKLVRQGWDPQLSPAKSEELLPQIYYFAAELGMSAEVAQVVETWASDRYAAMYSDACQEPQRLVLRLGSPELIAHEWRRLKLPMREVEIVRRFLACTEFRALDCIRDAILTETNKDDCEKKVQVLGLAVGPETAPHMLECRLSSRAPAAARNWLNDHLGTAIEGLIATASGKGKLAEAAVEFLRAAKKEGHGQYIASAIERLADAAAVAGLRQAVIEHQDKEYTPFDDRSTPTWLSQGLDEARKQKLKPLPGWVKVTALPPLLVGEHRLNDAQTTVVLQLLVSTPVNGRHALFDALHEHANPLSLDEFAWQLFQNWLGDGAPSKEKWAMGAIGLLGGDNCAIQITPLLRAWPGESQHQRAVFGLECLRAIGSNTALMQLSGIAQKLKFKGLKTKAEECVEAIAQAKGLTRAELEDRVVPDCGLDEYGRREFSFGSRSFSFLLGPDLKPMVRDAEGKLRGDLPKPSGKDDAAVAQASVDEWKLLKKQIKEVAKIQATRLEQAMCTGRRWKVDEFETLLVRHPLMTHLVRTLLWGAYDADGRLVASFRITDERDYADSNENPVSLQNAAQVGVIHPLHLSDEERAAWGEILSDYEIVPPFAQLGRTVYALATNERNAQSLDRYKGIKVPAASLVFGLEKLGWVRGTAMDGGCFDEHSKQFPAANVTAVVEYDGMVAMGYIDPDEILTVTSCVLVKGMRRPAGYGEALNEKLNLGDVDPIVMSEVISDMHELQSKAK